MPAQIISGTEIAKQIREELKQEIAELKEKHNLIPGLVTVLVGEDPASQVYVKSKVGTCDALGVYSERYDLPVDTREEKLLTLIDKLNKDPKVHGILVQLPLPKHINETRVLYAIDPKKDVDGFHPVNVGKLMIGEPDYLPCTPHGIQQLLIRSGVKIEGAEVVIVGRSNIVGKPIANILLQKKEGANATVTVCHTRSRDISFHTKRADILIVAVGKPKAITADMVKEGVVVIDVGVNRVGKTAEGKDILVGDVDFDTVKEIMEKITFTIDGIKVMSNKEVTILQAALEHGIYIPHLCYHPDLKPFGGCRLCTVEVEGRGLTISCGAPVKEGMVVRTESPEISKVRRIATELLILNHYADCLQCVKSTECKLLSIAAYIGIEEGLLQRLKRVTSALSVDDSNPFFLRDPNKCVLCGICVRTCQEIQGVGAIDLAFREYWKQWKKYQEGSVSSIDLTAQGDAIKIAAFKDKPIIESRCESCGECVVRCPVGALIPKNVQPPAREVKTICPYCGCGCGIYLGIRGSIIVNVRGDPDSPVNNGNLCVKGRFGYDFINHPERLTTPLIKRNGNFVEATWEEALDLVASKLANYKGDQFAIMGSGKITNEEIYLIQKFTRAVMGTNQAESPARICHLPTIIGLTESTGSSSMPFPIEQLFEAGCIIVAGSNSTETHPIIGLEIKRAVKKGVKLLVIDPRRTELAAMANVHLNLWPGTDVALTMGMCRVILEENLHAQDFINQRTEDFASFKETLQNFPLDFVEQVTRIPKKKIVDATRIAATFTPGAYLYAMGTTQHTHGADNVQALVNLALLTGSYGKLGGGVAPLRGHNNIHGATAFGTVTHLLPGYQYVTNPEHRKKFEKAWNCKINPEPGLSALEWVAPIHRGKVKAIYIVGNNPLRSWADINQTQKAFEQLEFLVVQDIFLTETAQMADVVLPGVSFAEKEGTFFSLDRRMNLIRKAINPIGDARPDWWILCEIGRRMGAEGFDFNHPRQVWEEIRSLAPTFAGITYERLAQEGDIYFPCPTEDHPGTKNLHWTEFMRKGGKAMFKPMEYKPAAELPDEEYPFILTTRRYLSQFHTFTRREKGLNELMNGALEINPKDVTTLGIVSGEMVRVVSRRGDVRIKTKVTDSCPAGVVALSFHFPETPINVLTNAALDPRAKVPETKVCAVRIEK